MQTTAALRRLALATFLSAIAAGAGAKEVTMAFGLTLPPYVIAENSTGFQLEIIKDALAFKGHTLKPVYVPLARVPEMIKARQVDAAERGGPDVVEGQGAHYSEVPAVVYQDYAISLKKSALSINSFADLKDKSVIAFQGATVFLGPEYAAAVKGNAQYSEAADQKRQALMLFSGRTQVVVGDHNIFKYFSQAVSGEVDTKQEVVFHKIFPSSNARHNHQVFVDRALRDDFDAGLKQLKASGRYEQIVRKYIKN